MKNLDALCAATAFKIEKDSSLKSEKDRKSLLNNITNGISVLQEDGIYAFYLFLKREKIEGQIWPACQELLANEAIGRILRNSMSDEEENIIKMTENMEHLFLAKDLLQRLLVYARYGMRSRLKKGK
ncbi:hypothetical protein JW964_27880 [candidate division KSB1 bacterium]|nr:hypothetical protein [candidate division KSB1 bacterium]